MLELNLTTPFSVRNTTFCSADSSVQYFVETPHSWGMRTTKVTKWTGPTREIVATMNWHLLALPNVRFARLGQLMDNATGNGKEFLKRGKYNKYW